MGAVSAIPRDNEKANNFMFSYALSNTGYANEAVKHGPVVGFYDWPEYYNPNNDNKLMGGADFRVPTAVEIDALFGKIEKACCTP